MSALIISAQSDPGGLLLERLTELHARLKPGQYPAGATRNDILDLSFGWTNGFWPGALWQAARLTAGTPGAAMFRSWALQATLQHLGHERDPSHDVGFMYEQSSLAAYQAICPKAGANLCGRLRRSALTAAGELVALARTNPVAGTIPTDATSRYAETIVDSIMNVLILAWATRQTGDPAYARLARHQSDVIARELVRPDGSTYQAVHFDRATGAIVFRGTHQGLSNTSSWARGQAWALYGFSELARQLHERGYLRVALHLAGYVADHLPAAGVPRWDYDAPPRAPVDVSAGAITAAGLEHLTAACEALAGACPAGAEARWRALAGRMLAAALRHASRVPPIGILRDEVTDERIPHCTCNGGELIYGLTYALEAIGSLPGR